MGQYRIIPSETSRYRAILVPVGIEAVRSCQLCQTSIAQGRTIVSRSQIRKINNLFRSVNLVRYHVIGITPTLEIGILNVTTPSEYIAVPVTFSPSLIEIGNDILLSI